ncbi:MAG TPA: hypothetical protein VKB05_05540 [Pyrinomonadaceae bacterium]|nr:hypothetical protein [Pyrinomonadaceae bacterium]
MNILSRKNATLTVVTLILVIATHGSAAAPVLPNPILYFLGAEYVQINGKQITRYRFDVLNKDQYPDDMFAQSPALPPCGANTKAARTWVDIYDQTGKRLNGFCALGKSADLNGIWFGLDTDIIPPSYIYIELNDRKTNTKYKSNLSDTTL